MDEASRSGTGYAHYSSVSGDVLPQAEPCAQFLGIGQGIGGAARRQPDDAITAGMGLQRLQPDPCRGPAVKRDGGEARQGGEQAGEIVMRVMADLAVQAALPLRLRDDVPQPDAVRQQRAETFRIVQTQQVVAGQCRHQVPETV